MKNSILNLRTKHLKTGSDLFDTLTFITGFLLPLMTIPQAYNVLVLKETGGVSLLTWSFYLLSSSLFAIYGIKHKQMLLIVTYSPFIVIESLIIYGILIN